MCLEIIFKVQIIINTTIGLRGENTAFIYINIYIEMNGFMRLWGTDTQTHLQFDWKFDESHRYLLYVIYFITQTHTHTARKTDQVFFLFGLVLRITASWLTHALAILGSKYGFIRSVRKIWIDLNGGLEIEKENNHVR